MYTSGETIGEQKTMASIQELCNKIPEVELRDLFALAALNGLASQPSIYNIKEEYTANLSYTLADAMLKARSNK